MVRINLLDPKALADQHLIAEYNEILMLLGHVRKHPEIKNAPKSYCLGKGHISFFKDKLLYLQRRHELLKKEMRRRGFKPTKTITLEEFPEALKHDWQPKTQDYAIIKKRISDKLLMKPRYYTYQGERRSSSFLLELLHDD